MVEKFQVKNRSYYIHMWSYKYITNFFILSLNISLFTYYSYKLWIIKPLIRHMENYTTHED